MNFLKNLFGGDGGGNSDDSRGLYFYVQPKRCEEIIEVRIDSMNDLSTRDDESGYIVRKMVSATRCPFQAELTVYFDKNRRVENQEVENGTLVSKEDYEAWQASRNS